jgi:glycosyltransferase involved in cell wall biosynthesis
MTWKKGLDLLVKAFALLLKKRQDIHLIIAGDDQEKYLSKVISWVKQYNIEAHVTFFDSLYGEEKMEALTGSDIFILPSYSENFGVAVIEALACGLPVIISNKVGIHNDIARHNAGLIVDTTHESVYNALLALLDNAELQKTIIKNGKELILKQFDINSTSSQMLDAFKHIVS